MERICLSENVLDLLDYGSLIVATRVSKYWLYVCSSPARRKRTLRLHGLDNNNNRRLRLWFWLHEAGGNPRKIKIPYAIYEPTLKLRVDKEDYSDFDFSRDGADEKAKEDGEIRCRTALEGEIFRDVRRTFPTHACFTVEKGLGQTMLFNILNALAVRYPQVGYCQGMNFVVAVMILVAAEAEKETSSATKKRNQSMKFSYEETTLDHIYKCQDKQHRVECTVFNLMCAFLDNFDMQELWRPCVPQLKLRIYQFGRLLHRKLPVLEAHFAEIGVTPDFFASQWFLTLMSYNLPLDLLVRVWDVLVIDGWKTIFRVGISLLKIFKSELMEMGLEELSRFFRHNKLSVAQQDLLRESFFNCKISTRLLSELESDYVGYVLRSQLYKEEGSKLNRSQALLLEPTKVIDKRLAASIQAEIESMELPLKNDIPILRGKIEQAEKARVEAYEEFKAAAEEYEAVRLDLEELRKANLAEKSDWIESQIETVNEKYQEVIWRTSQAQVILEEALERKNAFSQQLFVVMHENEQNKVAHITKFKSLLL